MSARIKKLLLLSATMTGLAGCGHLAEVRNTLEPDQAASFFGAKRVDQFGVCSPFHLDRRGTGLFMWREFIRVNAAGDPRYSNFHLAGHEIAVSRGESCHQRILDGFQTAMRFDLSTLPSTAVASATLELEVVRHGGTDAPYGQRTDAQCPALMFGVAMENWVAGRFGPGPGADAPRGLLAWRPIRNDAGPHARIPVSIDVTREVSEWARGARPNNGFVITPDLETAERSYHHTDNGGFLCTYWILNSRLNVSLLARE